MSFFHIFPHFFFQCHSNTGITSPLYTYSLYLHQPFLSIVFKNQRRNLFQITKHILQYRLLGSQRNQQVLGHLPYHFKIHIIPTVKFSHNLRQRRIVKYDYILFPHGQIAHVLPLQNLVNIMLFVINRLLPRQYRNFLFRCKMHANLTFIQRNRDFIVFRIILYIKRCAYHMDRRATQVHPKRTDAFRFSKPQNKPRPKALPRASPIRIS